MSEALVEDYSQVFGSRRLGRQAPRLRGLEYKAPGTPIRLSLEVSGMARDHYVVALQGLFFLSPQLEPIVLHSIYEIPSFSVINCTNLFATTR
jgi:hypothetical protein